MYPKAFKKLIENFSSLPSVGPKMAERLVLFLFKQNSEKLEEFSQNLKNIQNLKHCEKCHNISEENLCEICKNSSREQDTICVVEDPLDIISIEKTGAYKGLYHVLGGVLFSAGNNNEEIRIPQLVERIKKEKIKEIILATNPTTEGDATALYIKRKISDLGVKITRLARGLSTGGDIEYADETTLSSAIKNRN